MRRRNLFPSLPQARITHTQSDNPPHTPRDTRCKRKSCAKDAASNLLSQMLEEPGNVWNIQIALNKPSSILPQPAGAGTQRLVPHELPQLFPTTSPAQYMIPKMSPRSPGSISASGRVLRRLESGLRDTHKQHVTSYQACRAQMGSISVT